MYRMINCKTSGGVIMSASTPVNYVEGLCWTNHSGTSDVTTTAAWDGLRFNDHDNEAFRVAKMLIEKKLVKCKDIPEFIKLVDELDKIL